MSASDNCPSRSASFAGPYFSAVLTRRKRSADGQEHSNSFSPPSAKRTFEPERRSYLSSFHKEQSSHTPQSDGQQRLCSSERKLAAPSVRDGWEELESAADPSDLQGFRLVDLKQLGDALLSFCGCSQCNSGKF